MNKTVLRTEISVWADQVPQTNTEIHEEQGGEILCPDDIEYISELIGNTSGLAKATIDLNSWKATQLEFNDGATVAIGFHPVRGGYYLRSHDPVLTTEGETV